ncbi:Methionine aminopeptidase 1A [Ananas comosus]|uniref:Methionine aminopeptidase 1A n=1 Tax=Ananas comosus TaxID=4615 RepID=A0A199VMH1_ANACO|nr:Methionine aminopeptidase 1A [Ananas comosus]
MREVPEGIEKPDWAVDGIPKIEPNSDLQTRVEIKTPEQIERMRETCRIAREVLDAAARVIQPGITTDEIDRVVHEATIAAEDIHLTKLSFLSKVMLHVGQLMKSFAMESDARCRLASICF